MAGDQYGINTESIRMKSVLIPYLFRIDRWGDGTAGKSWQNTRIKAGPNSKKALQISSSPDNVNFMEILLASKV